ncbi:MAG TPA: hypothetical protein VID27_16460 [Blastocatellia bacterium]
MGKCFDLTAKAAGSGPVVCALVGLGNPNNGTVGDSTSFYRIKS